MKYKWSTQSLILAEKMKLTEAEMNDCEKWVEENVFIIGDKWVLNWLYRDIRKKFNK